MSISNKFTGKVLIIGVNEAELPGSLRINYPVDLPSSVTLRAEVNDELLSSIEVKYLITDDLPSTVHPSLSVELPSSVSVRPHNKMTGIVEVVEPPTISVGFYPIEDTYVRDGMPKLNYGRDGDQFVGTAWSGEKYRALLRFDTSSLPKDKAIKRATLVLGLLNSRPSIPIGIYEVPNESQWTEYGVTWDSQPTQGTLLKTYDSGTYAGKTEVDLTSYVSELYAGTRANNGLILKSLDESILGNYKQYGTRETADESLRPFLIVEYYDPTVYSFKRADLKSSVFVYANNKSELLSSVVVAGYVGSLELEGSLTVRDPFAPISGELPSSVGVTRDALNSSVFVLGRTHVDSSVQIRNQTSEQGLEGTVGVTRDYLPSTVRVKPYEDFPSSVQVKAFENHDLAGSVVVNAPEREGSIYVRFYQDLESSVHTRVRKSEDLGGSVIVNAPDRLGSVVVKPYGDLEGTVTSRRALKYDLLGSVVVNKPELPSSVNVRSYQDLNSTVVPRARGNNDLESSVFVVSEFIKGTVQVRQILDTELDSSAIVRRETFTDLLSSVIPRIPDKIDLASSVAVRADTSFDLPSTIIPRIVAASDIPSTVEVDIASNLPSSIEIRAWGESDLDSSVSVRYASEYDLDGTLVIRSQESKDLDSSVQVRITSRYDIDCTVLVRVSANPEIPSSVGVRVNSAEDLVSTVEVSGEDGGYVFMM